MIPTLTTARLTLGSFEMSHFEAFATFCAGDRSRFLGGPTTDRREAWDSCMVHCGQWQARGYGGFWASETASGRPVGRFSLWHPINFVEPELSWVLYEGCEGQGFAAEAATALRDWAGRDRGLGTLVSLIAPENARSLALAARLGAHREGEHTYPGGARVETWRHRGVAA
jgi:RimJ/RimL family protein N-acetyltransferase